MKLFIVGRHVPDFGNEEFEVVGQEAVTWPARANDCAGPLVDVCNAAIAAGAEAIVFQNMPTPLAAYVISATAYFGGSKPFPNSLRVGLIVSVPGERLAGVSKEFGIAADDPHVAMDGVGEIKRAVEFANPRAKVERVEDHNAGMLEMVRVTVDPPMPFVFSHIEWI